MRFNKAFNYLFRLPAWRICFFEIFDTEIVLLGHIITPRENIYSSKTMSSWVWRGNGLITRTYELFFDLTLKEVLVLLSFGDVMLRFERLDL